MDIAQQGEFDGQGGRRVSLRQVRPRHFPSGEDRPIAMLALGPQALEDRSDLVFTEQDGQHDRECFAAVQLAGGQLLWLVYPLGAPVQGMRVYADVGADAAACRQELLRELELTEEDVVWRPEAE